MLHNGFSKSIENTYRSLLTIFELIAARPLQGYVGLRTYDTRKSVVEYQKKCSGNFIEYFFFTVKTGFPNV